MLPFINVDGNATMQDTHIHSPNKVRYFLHGKRSKEALVCLGGPGPSLWAPLVSELKNRRFLVVIDFLHPPAAANADELIDVPTLAAAVERILDDEHIHRAAVAAWSLGVKVGVSLCERLMDRAVGSILLCGTAGPAFARDDSAPFPARFNFVRPMPTAASLLLMRADRILKLRERAASLKNPSRLAKRFGLIDALTDDGAFDAFVAEFLGLDYKTYSQYTEALEKFDASAALSRLSCPHLAAAGEKDALVLPMQMRAMAVEIKRCEYFEVKSGTHYLPLEYGELLALKIDDFLDRVKQR